MKTNEMLKTFYFLILLVAFVLPVCAEDESEDDGWLDVAATVNGKSVAEDSSKAEEYGEAPEGFLINRFVAEFGLKNKDRYLRAWGNNVRLNYADYGIEYGEYGKFKLAGDYSKIPHLFSKSAETIWAETSSGIWTVPDNLQQVVQGQNTLDPTDPLFSAAQTRQKTYFSDFLTGAQPFGLGVQRDRGNVAVVLEQSPSMKYSFNYFLENRDGYRPLGTSLGFSWVTELPERIDYQTQDFRAGMEYSKNGKLFVVNYDLALFSNEVQTITWDNPLRIDDRTYSSAYVGGDGTSAGRAQLPVDNTANTINVAAATRLGQGRLSGSFAFSSWTDSVDLLPHTINTVIPTIPLPASSFDGNVQNITASLLYTTRLGDSGSFLARYRLYDRTNKNDEFLFHDYVRFDQVLEEFGEEGEENPLFAYTSNSIDLDLGMGFADNWSWHAAYSFNRYDREHRDVNKANTNAFTTSLDWLGEDASMRFSYQYSRRSIDEYKTESGGTYAVIPLRRFDEAMLNRNLVRGDFTFMPGEKSSIGFNIVYGNDDYQETEFGLQQYKDFSISADYSYSVSENSSFDVWYEYQKTNSNQKGRQSGATPSANALDDWTVGIDDKFNTVGASFSTGFNDGKVVWSTDASYAMANGDLDIASPPGGILTPRPAIPITNADDTDWVWIKTGLTLKLTGRAKLLTFYKFDNYTIDDYAEESIRTDLTTFGTVTLNATQPDFEYHTYWVGLNYVW